MTDRETLRAHCASTAVRAWKAAEDLDVSHGIPLPTGAVGSNIAAEKLAKHSRLCGMPIGNNTVRFAIGN